MQRLGCATLFWLLSFVSAQAQNNWSTPGGSTATGQVAMCLNGSGLAVPCADGVPLYVVPATGSTFTVGGTIAQSGTWTVQPGNTANTTPWLFTSIPSAAAASGLSSAQTTAAATNLAVSGAHNVYGLQVTTAASAGRAMLFDATSLPANGAVTPKKCWSLGATTTTTISWGVPIANATGITIGFSTGADCYTLTAANAEFIAVDYK